MTFPNYLKTRISFLVLTLTSNLALAIIFFAFEIPFFIITSYYLLLLVSLGILLSLEYQKQRKFYNGLYDILDALEEKYLIAQMLPKAGFIEGEILTDTLIQTGKSMATHVSNHGQLMEEYRDYLELWIHEVKTPIATARLMIDNDGSQVAKNIGDQLDEVENYLMQALFYARSSHVEKDFLLKEMDIKQTVGTALKKHFKTIAKKKIILELDNLSGTVFSDPKWLEFILSQLISNALKYMTIDPKIIFYTTSKASSTTLHIKDNGIGIPTHDLPRIFEKSFTGDNGRHFEKSTGIGLYLCQKMCTQIGINIEVESQIQLGTTVSLTFPISDMYFKK